MRFIKATKKFLAILKDDIRFYGTVEPIYREGRLPHPRIEAIRHVLFLFNWDLWLCWMRPRWRELSREPKR